MGPISILKPRVTFPIGASGHSGRVSGFRDAMGLPIAHWFCDDFDCQTDQIRSMFAWWTKKIGSLGEAHWSSIYRWGC